MKQFLFLLAIVSVISCGHPAVKFTPKLDSVQVVYKDSVQGPFLFTGLYQVTKTFVPVGDSNTTTGRWVVDSVWAVKIQNDTFTTPGKPHTFRYQPVNKKYVQIISSK
jgi:hypothetical protein